MFKERDAANGAIAALEVLYNFSLLDDLTYFARWVSLRHLSTSSRPGGSLKPMANRSERDDPKRCSCVFSPTTATTEFTSWSISLCTALA